jgi:hypothetical protein
MANIKPSLLVEVIERINDFPGDGLIHQWARPRFWRCHDH